MFHINDFYLSVKKKLLWEAIIFARWNISVTSKDIEAIFHARKLFLYYNDKPWVENGNTKFDGTMGANCCFYVVTTS